MVWATFPLFFMLLLVDNVIEGRTFPKGKRSLYFKSHSTNDVNLPSRDENNRTKTTLEDAISESKGLTNVVQLSSMIKCMTGRSGLAYNNYGCYCGLGGSGTPVDGVDKCCQTHDLCYDKVEHQGCSWLNKPHIVVYKYKCQQGHISCYDKPDSCDRTSCDCDRDLSICLSKVKYNKKYKNYPSKRC